MVRFISGKHDEVIKKQIFNIETGTIIQNKRLI